MIIMRIRRLKRWFFWWFYSNWLSVPWGKSCSDWWKKHRYIGKNPFLYFDRYYHKKEATVLEIGEVAVYDVPMTLDEFGIKNPPQSLCTSGEEAGCWNVFEDNISIRARIPYHCTYGDKCISVSEDRRYCTAKTINPEICMASTTFDRYSGSCQASVLLNPIVPEYQLDRLISADLSGFQTVY